ncbi:MAG TPA: CxxxxCH/CxxCH domain-containing protein, partial [Planctomycetota bacterium]
MSARISAPRMVVLLVCLLGGLLGFSPRTALAKHNTITETTNCDLCHVMNTFLVEDNTAYLRAGARSLSNMKALNGNKVPSMKNLAAGPKSVGCTFCHYNTGLTTRMKDVLDQFGGRLSQHPVDRTYSIDNATTTRNVSLSANTNTTRWMSNWDNTWPEPANQIGCTDCHNVSNSTANAGTGAGGYPEHPEAVDRITNPVMLRGGAASWDNGISHASNSFCVNICHNGSTGPTSGYKMGHYAFGAYDNAGSTGTLKEPSKIPLRTSNCVDCHETHYSGSQKNLFGERGDSGRLLPSQSTNLITTSNCTNICHNDNTFNAVGHGRAISSSNIAMGVQCTTCHNASVAHRTPSNMKRLLVTEDSNKATLTEDLSTNGIDDDYDGVVDNPEEKTLKRSGESNCSVGSCHSDRHLHAGTGKVNSTPGSASCLQCHDMHGNGVDNNIRMIKSVIMGKTIRYTAKTDFMRVDNSATVANLCDNPGCHQKPLGSVATPGTILGDVPEHVQANVGPGYDCSGCHPHNSNTGGGSFLPACNSCHSYPGQSYIAGTHQLSPIHTKHVDLSTGYGYACSVCHYQYLHNKSGVTSASQWQFAYTASNVKIKFDGRVNPPNAFGPTYAGVAADNNSGTATAIGTATTTGNGACQGLYCHGNSASARVWSGYVGAPTWNDNTSGTCGTCHKATIANPPQTAAHPKHADNTAVGYGITCNTCHYATTSDGITITDRAAHVNVNNPQILVSWNNTDNQVKTGNPYSLATKTCSNIYCHSPGTKVNQAAYDNGAYGWPVWTQVGSITCNHCHGDATRTDGTPNYPNNSPKINSHPKHIASGDGCQMCHAQTTTTGTTITNRSNHVNAFYDVNNDNVTHNFSYAVPTCTSIACHGTNSATWGGASPQCSDCHLGTGDTNQFQTPNATWYAAGVAASIDNTEWLYSGHGRKTTNYDVSGNPPADFGTKAGLGGDPCYYCHDAGVGHRVATNPFRLAVQTGVTGFANSGWNATCLVCHSKTTNPQGYRPTGMPPYTLVNGAAADRIDTAHYGARHSASDNTGGGYFCWDCHDPHGNRKNSTTGNIYMMQSNVLPKTDGLYGARGASGELNAGMVFLKDNTVATGGDWARSDNKGLCQVCHHGDGTGSATTAKFYAQSSNWNLAANNHYRNALCISCHNHDKSFDASCSGCHGGALGTTTKNYWPDNVAGLMPDKMGRHQAHVDNLSVRWFNLTAAALLNDPASDNKQKQICAYCHTDPRGTPFGLQHLNGTLNVTMHTFWQDLTAIDCTTLNPTASYDNTVDSCSNVNCHNNKAAAGPTYGWYGAGGSRPNNCIICHTAGGFAGERRNPTTGLHSISAAAVAAGVRPHDNGLAANGCLECHWQAGWPAQSASLAHINGINTDNAALTLTRVGMVFTENAAVNRSTCQGFGLDNAIAVGCHTDRGAWKRLWSTEADNTATAVGSPRCNVCHGQWSTMAGSAGWRDNTSHFNADNAFTSNHGKTHDAAPELCTQCHPYNGGATHENKLITMNDNATLVSDNAVSRRAGCSQCHNGVDYANGKTPDTNHTVPLSVFPLQKTSGVQVTASCTTCHGDGASRSWPQKPGTGPASKVSLTADYNYNGEHLLHLTELATRLGGYNLADNAQWTPLQQQVLCNYCHDAATDPTHATAGPRAELFPTTGRKMMGGGVDNGSPSFVAADNSCAGVQCHNRKNTTATYNWYTGAAKQCVMCHTPGDVTVGTDNPITGLHVISPASVTAGVKPHDNSLASNGCRECHWNTGWPAQSTSQTHINSSKDNAATTLNRTGMIFTENAAVNRSTCQGFGLDNAIAVGCHTDRGAWKRLWSTEADNTATAIGSPRCNVCHGQWSTMSGSAGWRDNTSHFNADAAFTSTHGKTHDDAPELCTQCHPYDGGATHENKLITMNDNATRVSDNAVSGRAGCSQCHNGVDYANGKTPDINHTFPLSIFPMQKVQGPKVTASCTVCHGDGANRLWPQKPGVGPTVKVSIKADYNYNGEHLLHLTELATRLGGYNLADNSTWGTAEQQVLCSYCHDSGTDATHATIGPRATLFPATGRKMMGGGVDNGSPSFVTTDNSCAGVQCHNRKSTAATYNWYTGAAKQCVMCHTPGGAFDNNPRSGLHAVTAAGVTKHDNTLMPTSGLTGCQSCHWNTGWPAQSTTQTHINGSNPPVDNAALTLNRPNMFFVDNATSNRATCQGTGLDNVVGCHTDRGAWKRLWSTEADNTATAVGSPRCNVCHGQWSTMAGSAGWRDNTSHFNADSAF